MEDTKKEEKTEEKPKPDDMVEAANKAAKRLEVANDRTAELLAEQKAILVERTLGGRADAGQETKEKTKDELEIIEARKLLAGTGFDDQLFPLEKK